MYEELKEVMVWFLQNTKISYHYYFFIVIRARYDLSDFDQTVNI